MGSFLTSVVSRLRAPIESVGRAGAITYFILGMLVIALLAAISPKFKQELDQQAQEDLL